METDKFEKYIKAQLKDREIEPSSNAWESISRELNGESPKKKPLAYLWMSIAASILVLVGIASFYFNDFNQQLKSPVEVVETNKEDGPRESLEQNDLPLQTQEAVVQLEDKVQMPLDTENDVLENNQSVAAVNHSVVLNKIEVADLGEIEAKNAVEASKLPEQVINDKVTEIVAQVAVLEQYDAVTDAEVDSLLKRAQQDILRDRIFKSDAPVDAMALLTEVEEELDQSFREQIFNSLKDGFIKVRTAVADRNN